MSKNRSISYREFWWENVEDFLSDLDPTLKESLKKTICFVYKPSQ